MSDRVEGAVVVGIDGSDSAREATRWAAREAERRGVPLRLVAAAPWTSFRPIGVPALGQEYGRRVVEKQAAEHLAEAAGIAEEAVPGLPVDREVRGGEAQVVLREESERAALVVLGSRGRGGFTALLLGSVAIGVAAHAAGPVVVVRGTPANGPVLVGVDGGDDSALGFAFEEATRRGVHLVVVHAVTETVLDPFLVPLVDWSALQAEEERRLRDRLGPWTGKFPAVGVDTVVVMDGAARELVARSEEAGLVVVGSRGRGTLRGPLLGSVSQAVLHHAACPVAVVRPEEG
ncbi:universal stress protein [Pseudonocardia xishanensis]|uniref:Universal stress protein n=1 Tax=Pseudonocardia xishanensis TaxID=630995 RepID=A0ABP8RT68_9PSEU